MNGLAEYLRSDQANLLKYKKLMLDVGINHALEAAFCG